MMSSLDQRILLYKSSDQTWTDCTMKLNDPNNGQTQAFSMLPGDYIYISAFLPLNHKFFKITGTTANARAPRIEVNDAATWSDVADMIDHTASMASSGNLQFTRDRDKRWGRVSNNKRDMAVMTSAPVTIYDSYWIRISFPTDAPDPDPMTFTLEFIGQCFSTDNDLFAEYPALRNASMMTSWKPGKADWNDQHILASCYIAQLMRQRKIIESNEQLLDLSTLVSPAVHKVAAIVYSGLGAKNYEKEILAAGAAFEKAMTMGNPQVDQDKDGIKGMSDRRFSTSRATR